MGAMPVLDLMKPSAGASKSTWLRFLGACDGER
jgi:hypothetical protein